jgi:hypothetical protein
MLVGFFIQVIRAKGSFQSTFAKLCSIKRMTYVTAVGNLITVLKYNLSQ